MDRNGTILPSRRNARKLAEYFLILNSGDEASWERAFQNTWHPEAIIRGRTCAELKVSHRGLLGKGRIRNLHVVRDIDDHDLEYTLTVDGRYDGPFWATFREGRIYRIF